MHALHFFEFDEFSFEGISGFSRSLFHLLNQPDILPALSKFCFTGRDRFPDLELPNYSLSSYPGDVSSAISCVTDETYSVFVILQHLQSKSSPAKPQPGVAYVHWCWVNSFIIAIPSIKTSEIRLSGSFNAECIRHKFCQRLMRSGVVLS